jgi:hypothetical protein
MADDRYDWLDEEAAELLLRGLPVDASCDVPEELVAALGALRRTAPRPEPDELPGEAAAVAAFLAARPAAPAAGRGAPAFFARLSSRCRPPVHSARHPLRAGLAVAVAGFALCGVAVAAGTGVLPTPFSGGPTAPAVSVSPMGGPSAGDAGGADGTTDRPNAAAGTMSGGSAGSPDAVPGATPTPDGGRNGDGPNSGAPGEHSTEGALSEVDQEALVDTLCSAYTHDELNAQERSRLEQAAGGGLGVRAFCAAHGVSAAGAVTGGTDESGDGGKGGRTDRTPPARTESGDVDVVGGAGGGLPDGQARRRGGDTGGDTGGSDGRTSGGDGSGDHGSGDQGSGDQGSGDQPSPSPSAVTPSGSPSPTPSASGQN